MAITILQYPVKNDSSYLPRLHPVGNGIVYIVTSDNNTKKSFSYIAIITHPDGTQTTLKAIPDSVTGYGFFQLEKVLKNYVSSKPYFDKPYGAYDYIEYYYDYKIDFYESYTEEWEFDDNFYSPIGTEAYVGFVSTQPHNFEVGQLINIVQDEPFTNPEYNGYHTILEIPNSTYIITDIPWGLNTPAEGGTITDAYNRALINYSQSAQSQTCQAINAKFKPSEFLNWNTKKNSITGLITIDEAAFLYAGYNKLYDLRKENTVELLVNCNSSNEQNTARISVLTIALPGETLPYQNFYFSGNTDNTNKVLKVKVGPADFDGKVDLSGNTLDMSKVDYYFIHMADSNNLIRTQLVKTGFKIDHTCDIYNQNIQVLFEDRFGSFLPFNFELVSTQSLDGIEKNTYLQKIGGWNGTNYTYTNQDKGDTIFNISRNRIYIVNSNWINETMADLIEDMFISKNVYAKLNGEWFPIIIQDTNYIKKTRKNTELINYQITFKLSNNE